MNIIKIGRRILEMVTKKTTRKKSTTTKKCTTTAAKKKTTTVVKTAPVQQPKPQIQKYTSDMWKNNLAAQRIEAILAEYKTASLQNIYMALDTDQTTHNTSGIYGDQLRFTLKDETGKEYSYAVTEEYLKQDSPEFPLVWTSTDGDIPF